MLISCLKYLTSIADKLGKDEPDISMDLQRDLVLGIYISGSHITTALVDTVSNEILEKTYYRTKINSWGSRDHIISSWCDAIKKTAGAADLTKIKMGIAMPGQFDYDNGICYIRGNKKYDALYGVNIKELLAQQLNSSPDHIRMLNDAAAFLQGELRAGVIKNSGKAIALTLGTGLGTAVYSGGIVRDAELWDSPFLDSKAENYISTKWFMGRYFEATGMNVVNIKALNNLFSESATVKSIFKDFTTNLGILIRQFVEKEQPEVIILGGDITIASSKFLPDLKKNLQLEGIDIPIHVSSMGDRALIFGASSSWSVK